MFNKCPKCNAPINLNKFDTYEDHTFTGLGLEMVALEIACPKCDAILRLDCRLVIEQVVLDD